VPLEVETVGAITISECEAVPASWPEIHPDLTVAEQAAIWRRVEGFIAWRFNEREVVYVAEGIGPWRPRLRPFTVDLAEQGQTATGWSEVTLDPEPLGGVVLPGNGPFRLTRTVGDEAVPQDVAETLRRLGAYQFSIPSGAHDPALIREEADLGRLKIAEQRAMAWPARAMTLSGAADLLRPYRGLGAGAWA
jgi:hypothetical protein